MYVLVGIMMFVVFRRRAIWFPLRMFGLYDYILGKFVSISYLLISSSSKNVKVIKCSLPFLREEFLVLIHGVSSEVTDNNVGLDRRH
jgi:hypothetical protein